MLYFLLAVIAVGVLLLSETGSALLSLLIKLVFLSFIIIAAVIFYILDPQSAKGLFAGLFYFLCIFGVFSFILSVLRNIKDKIEIR